MDKSKLKPLNRVYRKFTKPIMDFIFAFVLIIILFPLLLAIYLLVLIKLGKPAIFKQQRPGYKEKIFTIYKFRTMTDKKDNEGNLLPDSERLTKFGKFLRSTSIDELPELFNILKGDMSFIGPRPLLVQYIPLYNSHQGRRHEVRPGLSGLSQVNGRNAISWEEKFNLDVEYVDCQSIIYDLKLIFKTIHKVILREGISSNTASTMEPFKGTKGNRYGK
ncbi:MAG TPA: sugar transferase [Bacteroidales bacterium]|nr:sugar transferase [Bacteroidales bacterium]